MYDIIHQYINRDLRIDLNNTRLYISENKKVKQISNSAFQKKANEYISYIPVLNNIDGAFDGLVFYDLEENIDSSIYSIRLNGYYSNSSQASDYSKTRSVFREFQEDVKNYFDKKSLGRDSVSHILTEGLKYTFGVEIETISGFLPYWVYFSNKLSLTCVRDGSLRNPDGSETGGEYVTGVLDGDLGFYNLKKSLSKISERCTIDSRCGIHVHVGGCNFNPQFSVLAYILALKIEDEVFNTLPPSRKDNDTCGRLIPKDYLNILKKYNLNHGVDICYLDFFKSLSNGRELSREFNKLKAHPGGRYTDRYSRNIPIAQLYRYKWLNFIPCNFNMKGNERNPVYTIEFRSHPASLNFEKIKNWVLFCFAFCNYVENKSNDIINKDVITIEDILQYSYPKKYKELVEYFNKRKETFSKDSENASKIEKLEYKQTTPKIVTEIKKAIF